jgi:hypothetical protein
MESIATPAMPTSPGHARMIAVVAAVGREVERDRQALLAGGEVAAVEGVALRRSRSRRTGGPSRAGSRTSPGRDRDRVCAGSGGREDGTVLPHIPLDCRATLHARMVFPVVESEFQHHGDQSPSSAWASFSVCSTSQPMKMFESMLSPSCLPAIQTCCAPASFRALAAASASSA